MPIYAPSSDPAALQRIHTGCVLATYESNGGDDSEFYAVVYHPATADTPADITDILYASTRFSTGRTATVDATPETIALANTFLVTWGTAFERRLAEHRARLVLVSVTPQNGARISEEGPITERELRQHATAVQIIPYPPRTTDTAPNVVSLANRTMPLSLDPPAPGEAKIVKWPKGITWGQLRTLEPIAKALDQLDTTPPASTPPRDADLSATPAEQLLSPNTPDAEQ